MNSGRAKIWWWIGLGVVCACVVAGLVWQQRTRVRARHDLRVGIAVFRDGVAVVNNDRFEYRDLRVQVRAGGKLFTNEVMIVKPGDFAPIGLSQFNGQGGAIPSVAPEEVTVWMFRRGQRYGGTWFEGLQGNNERSRQQRASSLEELLRTPGGVKAKPSRE